MAGNGNTEALASVLAALTTLQSNVDSAQKSKADEYLQQFQKTTDAWTMTFAILHSTEISLEGKFFAATTLKEKIVWDLYQLPNEAVARLPETFLSLLVQFQTGPRPIRTQLCLCLANLAVHMTEWKDVLPQVVSTLGNNSQSVASLLGFLHVLPEQFSGRKINLTEDELASRIQEVLEDNAHKVVTLLTQYATSSATAAKDSQLLECITSWLREVPINDIINGPLLDTIMNSLNDDGPFDSGVNCLCAVFKETRDVDACLAVIQTLYPRILSLKPQLSLAAQEEDYDTFRGLTRIFVEAGEAWLVLIARAPEQFQSLVEAIVESIALDKERDATQMTFQFWYDFKQQLTAKKFEKSLQHYVGVWSKLVDIMMSQLEYPKPESGNEDDLFEGDRMAEENFRHLRHEMGDVLKDSTNIIGVEECLFKAFGAFDNWLRAHATQTTAGQIPEWQKLEATLFTFRALGRMVPLDENIVLPQFTRFVIQIPDHDKIRFQVLMALGRYTAWTAEHPDILKPQFDYIVAAFDHQSREVRQAAALSMRFFCQDCAEHLKGYTKQLQQLYEDVRERLPMQSEQELTEGVAAVVMAQPTERVYEALKLFCDPLMQRSINMAQSATTETQIHDLADSISLLTIFFRVVQTQVPSDQENPAVKYCLEIFSPLSAILDRFPRSFLVQERICRCWRYMVLSYRVDSAPLLPQLVNKLSTGFTQTQEGCFIWASDAIMREFSEDKAHIDRRVDQTLLDAVFKFFEQQTTSFLRILNGLTSEELPDMIDDYFNFANDTINYFPRHMLASQLTPSILAASCTSLTVLKEQPITNTLHFLHDLLAWGEPTAPISQMPNLDSSTDSVTDSTHNRNNDETPPEIRQAIHELVPANGFGETLTQRCLTGMLYSFPEECISQASSVLLKLFQLFPAASAQWTADTITLLPVGSVVEQERDRLRTNIAQRIESQEIGKVRPLLQDFCSAFRRRNVAPREGLGRLEGGRFRFAG